MVAWETMALSSFSSSLPIIVMTKFAVPGFCIC